MKYYLKQTAIEDIDKLSKIMKSAFTKEPWNEKWSENECYERLEIFYRSGGFIGYTLMNDDKMELGGAFGYVVPYAGKKEYILQEFFISPGYEGEHLGTFLMSELLKKLQEEGVDIIHLYTCGRLDRFYSKFGFERIEDEYIMKMKLTKEK